MLRQNANPVLLVHSGTSRRRRPFAKAVTLAMSPRMWAALVARRAQLPSIKLTTTTPTASALIPGFTVVGAPRLKTMPFSTSNLQK
jgi:hypothetical protein